MPLVGAQIYCHFCSSEALWKGSFALHHLEGARRLVVLRGWVVLLTSPALLPFMHFHRQAHTIPFLLLVLV